MHVRTPGPPRFLYCGVTLYSLTIWDYAWVQAVHRDRVKLTGSYHGQQFCSKIPVIIYIYVVCTYPFVNKYTRKAESLSLPASGPVCPSPPPPAKQHGRRSCENNYTQQKCTLTYFLSFKMRHNSRCSVTFYAQNSYTHQWLQSHNYYRLPCYYSGN